MLSNENFVKELTGDNLVQIKNTFLGCFVVTLMVATFFAILKVGHLIFWNWWMIGTPFYIYGILAVLFWAIIGLFLSYHLTSVTGE
jgi:hypothetical protein